MSKITLPLTGIERQFDVDEIIVSKTDPQGRITYANQVFLRVAQYTEAEVLGKPHNMIRHPHMPRCVFQLLWDTITQGEEIFAYVLNRAKYGDHYWVFAHVTPTFDRTGRISGYHSSRRVAAPTAVATVSEIYKQLLEVESRQHNPKDACAAGYELLLKVLQSQQISYGEFVFSLARKPATIASSPKPTFSKV
jgi:PAS domain S-box-containing protein